MGVDGYHPEDFAACTTQRLYGLEAAAARGDQILDDEYTARGGQLALDLVAHAVILSCRTHVDEGQPQKVCHKRSLSNSTGSYPGDDLRLAELLTDGSRQLVLDQATDLGIGEGDAVVAVDGGLPA